jgi:DNA-binding response OmpR family regulator
MPPVISEKRILVCDDDSDIANMLQTLLTGAGYNVTTANEHSEFFTKLDAVNPDLIMLDIRMPEHDGFWIAEELQRRKNKAPVIFVTAHNRSVYRLCAPIAGAVDFILKPFDPMMLLEKVKKTLSDSAASSSWFLYATCHHPANADQSTE